MMRGFPLQGGPDKVVGNPILKKPCREYNKRPFILSI